MSRLQVLVAAMHQTDFSLIKEMNIHADVIIANQADEESFREYHFGDHTAKMITTRTRGVGKNRNIALAAADAEIVLFADDDLCYKDGVFDEILRAFDALPQADLLTFSADIIRNGSVIWRRRNKTAKCHVWNSMQYGAAFLAARRQSLTDKQLTFSELFGGGCIYGSGEDSLFVKDCLHSGLTLYSHSCVLCTCAKDASSWFDGYNKKFFYDKGAWIAAAFPATKHFLKYYFLLRFCRCSELPVKEQIAYMNSGIRNYPARIPYQNDETNA